MVNLGFQQIPSAHPHAPTHIPIPAPTANANAHPSRVHGSSSCLIDQLFPPLKSL